MEDERICFLGERRMLSSSIISALTSTKMLKKECAALLALMESTEDDVSNFADIPMVCRFLDIFFGDLPGLSPVKELEFGIDLAADT